LIHGGMLINSLELPFIEVICSNLLVNIFDCLQLNSTIVKGIVKNLPIILPSSLLCLLLSLLCLLIPSKPNSVTHCNAWERFNVSPNSTQHNGENHVVLTRIKLPSGMTYAHSYVNFIMIRWERSINIALIFT